MILVHRTVCALSLTEIYNRILMKKLPVAPIALLFLFFCTTVVAEEEKWAKNVKVSTVNQADLTIERHHKEIDVKIQNDGKQIIVDASFTVPVMPHHAWAVLTDFDNIPNFITGIQSSKVTHRTGNHLQVSQTGATKFGFFTFSFESVRKINLSPFSKIQERMISGNMRAMEETTQLLPEGNQTRIVYHANIIPNLWILRFAGQIFIENEARKQFQDIRNEMIRREQRMISSR